MKDSIDERIDHRVCHSAEEDPHSVSIVYVRLFSGERVNDEHDLVGCPAGDEGQHYDGRHP